MVLTRQYARRPATRGFTLVELLITVAILAIIVTMALPSFSSTLRSNRVTTQANGMVAALASARAESVVRSRHVTICAADVAAEGLPAACGEASDWSKGWVIFVDTATGAPTAIDAASVIQIGEGNDRTDVSTNVAYLRFSPRGDTTSASTEFVVAPDADCSGDQRRRIQINRMGRASMTRVGCT